MTGRIYLSQLTFGSGLAAEGIRSLSFPGGLHRL